MKRNIKTVILQIIISIILTAIMSCHHKGSCFDYSQGALSSVRDDQISAKKLLLNRGLSSTQYSSLSKNVLIEKGNSGSWVQTNGPTGGIINAFAVSTNASGANVMFAGTFDGGVYTASASEGKWDESNSGLPPGVTVFALLVTPNGTNNNKIFAGTDVGMYVSANNGTSWVKSNTGMTDTSIITSIITYPDASGGTVLFAGSADGLYKSTNNGQNWSAIQNTILVKYGVTSLAYQIDASGIKHLFAASWGNRIAKSTDDGVTWKVIDNGITRRNFNFIFSLSLNSGGNKLLTCADEGLFQSTDYGESWSEVKTISPEGLSIYSITQSPDKKLYMGTTIGVYVSSDEGANWSAVDNNNRGWDIYSLASFKEGSTNYVLAGMNGKGIVVTTNSGVNWEFLNTGLKDMNVTAMATINTPNGPYVLASLLESRVVLTTNNGAGWNDVFSWGIEGPLYSSFVIDQVGTGPANIFAGSLKNGVFLSSDYGTTWASKSIGISGQYIMSMAISGVGTANKFIFAGTALGVYASNDNGDNWYSSSIGMPDSLPIAAMAVAPNSSGGSNIFAGTFGSGIYMSKTNGALWSKISSGAVDTALVLSLAVNSAGNTIFISTYNQEIYKSTNTGVSWSKVNSSSMSVINSLLWVGNTLFAGTNSGVYLTSDFGNNWEAVNSGIANRPVLFLARAGNTLFAGTGGSSIWQRPLSEMNAVEDRNGNNLPVCYELKQNYPNPFNPNTVINYSLPRQAKVAIKIYDALGKEVTTLIDGEKPAGNYSVEFKSNSLSSGIYYYRMKTDEAVITKKMVLMK